MGKGQISKGGGSLIEADFIHLAIAWEMPVEEAKKNVFELLSKQFKSQG